MEKCFLSIVLGILSPIDISLAFVGLSVIGLLLGTLAILAFLLMYEEESYVISLCNSSDLRPDNFNPLDLHCSFSTLTVNFWKGVISLLFNKKVKWLFVWVLCTSLRALKLKTSGRLSSGVHSKDTELPNLNVSRSSDFREANLGDKKRDIYLTSEA